MTLKTTDLNFAATLLKKGEVIAFPTETVYGLGAAIFQEGAIAKIFEIKGRPSDNPLIAHISSSADLSKIVSRVPREAEILMEAFFPGPLTLVLPKHQNVPSIVSGGGETIAFRMPSHPIARKLIELVGEPIVAPSANLSGRPSPTCIEHVLQDFEGKIPAVVDGGVCAIGIESTVVSLCDVSNPVLLRPGVITKEEIEGVLGRNLISANAQHRTLSPGMRYRHYAPRAKIYLFRTQNEIDKHVKSAPRLKRKIAVPTPANLYALLRASDQEGCEEICLHCDDEIRSQAGLMNRLLLASGKKEE